MNRKRGVSSSASSDRESALRIGVDLGGTKTESVLLDERGCVVERRRTATPQQRGYDAVLEEIVAHVRHLDARGGGRALPVGIGTPGVVDAETGRLKNSNTECLRGRALRADLEEKLGRPIQIANDANCFALAEARAGAGRGASVVFGVILGTGVGGGLVIDGRVRVGLHGIAGEWGHSPIGSAPGPPCYCGQRGCVETRLSGPAFEEDHRRLAGLDVAIPAKTVLERADASDPLARAAVSRYLEFFGEGLARVIHILDPDVIVLGGGMSRNPFLYGAGHAAVARVLFNDRLRTPIVRHELGDSAGVLGAAWLTADASA